MLIKIDTLEGAARIDYDATDLPLMWPTKEVLRVTGLTKHQLFKLEREKWIASRQVNMNATKMWHVDEVLQICGYNPKRRRL